MKGRLLTLNVLLAGLCGLLGWKLQQNLVEAQKREEALLRRTLPPAPAPQLLIPPPPAPAAAGPYVEVAAKLLMSRDRNPNVVIEEAPQKPMPALPRFYGILAFGQQEPYMILAAGAGQPQKKYRVGEKVGEFTIKALDEYGITFVWEEKTVKANFDEIRDKTPTMMVSQGVATTANPEPASNANVNPGLVSLGGAAANRPGVETSATSRACVPGDGTPNGAVVDGFRKEVRQTPFGNSCQWVAVR